MDIVAKMLGHTSARQTKTYAQLLDNAVFRANSDTKPALFPTNFSTGNSPFLREEELSEFNDIFK